MSQGAMSAVEQLRQSIVRLAHGGRTLNSLPCPVCGHPERNCMGKVTSDCYPFALKAVFPDA